MCFRSGSSQRSNSMVLLRQESFNSVRYAASHTKVRVKLAASCTDVTGWNFTAWTNPYLLQQTQTGIRNHRNILGPTRRQPAKLISDQKCTTKSCILPFKKPFHFLLRRFVTLFTVCHVADSWQIFLSVKFHRIWGCCCHALWNKLLVIHKYARVNYTVHLNCNSALALPIDNMH